MPGDATVNPVDVTASLARGARMRGVRIVEHTRVTGIATSDGRVTGVITDRGAVEADVVVNCAGQWAKAVGLLCGVDVPLHSAEHFYVVTEAIEGVHPDLPILRDPDGYTYMKEEVGGLVVGGFEPKAKPWVAPDALPYPFEFQLLEEDWDHFSVLMESAVAPDPRPAAHRAQEAVTTARRASRPTTSSSSARRPGSGGFFVGAGFNSVGIASGGGAGRALAEWIVEGEPTSDLAGRRHPALRPVQRQQPMAARPGGGGPRPPLRGAVAQPGAGDGPPVPPFAAPSPARRTRGRSSVRRWDGSGRTSSRPAA